LVLVNSSIKFLQLYKVVFTKKYQNPSCNTYLWTWTDLWKLLWKKKKLLLTVIVSDEIEYELKKSYIKENIIEKFNVLSNRKVILFWSILGIWG